MTDLRIADAPGRRRYEAHLGDDLAAFATYRRSDGVITFLHTETLPGYEGRGVATKLARFALDAARDEGLRVRPLCPFITQTIARFEEYAPLVDRQAGTESGTA